MAQTDTTFIYTYGNSGSEIFNGITPTSDTGTLAVGSSASFGNSSDVYIVKTDSKRNFKWGRIIGGSNVDVAYDAKETMDGGFIIVGSTNSYNLGDYDVFLIKTTETGSVQWQKTLGGDDWDFGYKIKLLPDSGFIIIGETHSFNSINGDGYLIRTDKNGDLIWEKNIGELNNERLNDFIISHNNFIYAIGSSLNNTGDSDIFLIKADLNGNFYDTSIIGDNVNQFGWSIIEHQLDSMLVIGGSSETGYPYESIYYSKIDTSFNLIWEFYNPCPDGISVCRSIIGLSNYDILYSGITSYGLGMRDGFAFISQPGGWWTPNGWTAGGTDPDEIYASTITVDNKYVFAGFTSSFGNGIKDAMIITMDTVANNNIQEVSAGSSTVASLGEMVVSEGFKIYPNPSNDYLMVEVKNDYQNYQIKIIDILGNTMFVSEITQNSVPNKIKCIDFPAGLYTIIISHELSIMQQIFTVVR